MFFALMVQHNAIMLPNVRALQFKDMTRHWLPKMSVGSVTQYAGVAIPIVDIG
jgi:hypothetical protein